MNPLFADRMSTARRSFVREILKVTEKPEIISFAGGLPNPKVFPVSQISDVTRKVLEQSGRNALQYSTTEGFLPLREYIAARYLKKKGLKVSPDDILITSGSQQGLDLLGKVFLNKGDTVVMERPGYLGAIQAFSIFEPRFVQITLADDGIDIDALDRALGETGAKIFYAVPNFQNPSGISYSREKREAVARVMAKHRCVLVEDDPYGELRFRGTDLPYIRNFIDGSVLLGTFSKIVCPGLRLGWVCAPSTIMEKLITAKQAADLHSNILAQRIVHQHLTDNDLDTYLVMVREEYRKQRDRMVACIKKYFPKSVRCTEPDGGMFLWATLPEGVKAIELLEEAIKEQVAFVPGDAFYADGTGSNTMRLNYSNSDEDQIEEGIRRLAKVMKRFLGEAR